jgi:hypothetical protein
MKMKQILIYVLIPLVVGLIIAYFTYYLNKEYVELRYTLSEKIPTRFLETSPAENVQQLVVKNTGDIAVKEIRIKIDRYIEDFDILKYSMNDEVKENKYTEQFVSIYPILPPKAQFVYIFKTSGSGINNGDIEITHDKGKAIEALTGADRPFYKRFNAYFFLYGYVVFIIIFVIVNSIILFNSIVNVSLEGKGKYTSFHEYLNKKKPFYVSQEKWKIVRRKFIESKREAELFFSVNEIEEQENYKILNREKPEFVTDDEWELLKSVSLKSLLDQLNYLIKTKIWERHIIEFFALKKPKYFPENKWGQIIDEINRNFIAAKKFQSAVYFSPKEIAKEIENEIPVGISQDFWNEYKEFLKKRYYDILLETVLRLPDPLDYLAEYNFDFLDKDEKEKLLRTAYKIQLLKIDDISSSYSAERFMETEKPEWIESEDYKRITEKANSYIDLEKDIRKNKDFLNAIERIVSLTPLKEKPDSIDTTDWNHLLDLESKISTIAAETKDERIKLDCEKKENEKLKSKILLQLKIIDNVLSSPESINRVEEYDNPFSKGNFENIQRIAAYLTELQQSKM